MREIKFRAKVADSDYENEKQIEMIGSLVHFTGFIGSENNIGYVEQLEEIYGVGWFNVDLKTLGQYTGLKDKNGKEIYEGDIVRENYDGESEDGVVIFRDGSFNVRFKPEEELLIGCDSEETEIIGNIYENHELLEELQNESK